MKLRFSHAVLYVRDLEAMLDFYGRVLGFAVSDRGPLDPRNPGLDIAFLTQVGTDHHQLAFVPVRGEGASTTLDHLAFRVESLSDVQAMAARLAADGRATEVAPINHGNAWSVYFKDPEGNRIEVFCDSPFHVQQPQVRPLDLSLDEDGQRRATEQQFGGEPGFGSMAGFRETQRRHHGS